MISKNLFVILIVFFLIKGYGIFQEQGKFLIKIYDVGQGDAILIRTPEDYLIVIDGGPDYEADRYLDKEFLINGCRIDLIILTHPHKDHIKSLNRLLERCKVGRVVFNPVEYDSRVYRRWLDKIKGVDVLYAVAGDVMSVGSARLVFVWPVEIGKDSNNINNSSVSVLLDYKDFEVLFLGDLEKEASRKIDLELLDKYVDGPLEVYKVPHHGSLDSHNIELLTHLQPKMCAVSVGEVNKFSHPSEEALVEMEDAGCSVIRTDEWGTIEVLINRR